MTPEELSPSLIEMATSIHIANDILSGVVNNHWLVFGDIRENHESLKQVSIELQQIRKRLTLLAFAVRYPEQAKNNKTLERKDT